jgi:pimeloyl-ACP methyl ester carboxylesterase
MDATITRQTALAQRSLQKIYFNHKDMDYYLSWILGREIYEGCDSKEVLEVASSITDGDPASWQQEWAAFAPRIEAQAEDALKRGDRAIARRAYLRACTYYRAPLFIMGPTDPAFRTNVSKMQACFRAAMPLMEQPIEAVSVPFQGKTLTGYFWQVDASAQKRPTLIVIGGIETWAEDCYFMIGSTGAEHGYNVLTFDLPGQGMMPEKGMYFDPKMGPPVKAVIDYALKRPEVDGEQLAAYGFSWGGHVVMKGAVNEPRLKAMIANPAMPDVFRAALAQQKGHDRNDPVNKVGFPQIAWRMGLKISFNPADIGRRFGKAYNYLVHGKANLKQIQCPALLLAGEGEARITLDIARECINQLPDPQKKLIIFTKEQNGEAHCQVNNLLLPNHTIFEWLDQLH